MIIYLEEYINDDVYDYLKNHHTITKNKEACECIITRNLIVNRDFIDMCPNLKCIAMYGTGLDAVDIKYASEKNIAVFNAPGQNPLSVAELNVALMLTISRKLEKAMDDTKHKGIIDYDGCCGNELTGKTAGFIGYGNISNLTAKILKNGFSMNTIFYNRSQKISEYATQKDLDYVLKNSDYIIVGLSLNDETRHIINKDYFNKMKKSAYLINATRGAIINHVDLLEALHNKTIRGYAADVFEEEPADINDPLFKENVVATSHIGGNTTESLYRVGMMLAKEIEDFEKKIRPIHQVNL